MNKKYGAWLSAVLLVLFSTTGVLARGQTEPVKPPASRIKMAEEAYKNVQSLKGIPADQLVPSMLFITYSLGVECSFCHVEGAFEKDDKKPKQIARKMIQMMFAINHENFEGKREVTCYSCHRGSSHPLATQSSLKPWRSPLLRRCLTTTEQALPACRPQSRFLPNMSMRLVARQPLESCLPESKREPSVSAVGNCRSTFSAKPLAGA